MPTICPPERVATYSQSQDEIFLQRKFKLRYLLQDLSLDKFLTKIIPHPTITA